MFFSEFELAIHDREFLDRSTPVTGDADFRV
jgi:hypothetical protein